MKLKSIYLILPLVLSLMSCGEEKDWLKNIFIEDVTYTTRDDMLTFKFHNNLEFGTGFAKLDNNYEPISFRLSKDDPDYSFTIHFENIGYEMILKMTTRPTNLEFVSGLDIALLDPNWVEWSSSFSHRILMNIDYDAKHYYGSTFENPYYGLEMDYTFKDFNTFDMEGAGEYEGLSFSFLPGKRFKIDYDGKESTGAYETTVKTLYLDFEVNNLIDDLPNIRIPLYVK